MLIISTPWILLTSTTYEVKENLFCHGLGKNFVCSGVMWTKIYSSDLIQEASGALHFGFVVLFVCLFVCLFCYPAGDTGRVLYLTRFFFLSFFLSSGNTSETYSFYML